MTGIVVVLVLPGVVCIVTVVGEDVVVGCAVDEPGVAVVPAVVTATCVVPVGGCVATAVVVEEVVPGADVVAETGLKQAVIAKSDKRTSTFDPVGVMRIVSVFAFTISVSGVFKAPSTGDWSAIVLTVTPSAFLNT
jgi:hypothetical protein